MVKTVSSLRRVIWLALIGLAIFLFSHWYQRPHSLDLINLHGSTMGTYYNVKLSVNDADSVDIDALKKKVDSVLIEVNATMSTYEPKSEISLFNASRSTEPVEISDDLATVINEAIRIGTVSDGALDITVGPLVNLWGFGPDGRPNRVPSEQKIKQASKRVGLSHLHLKGYELSKTIPGLYVDLSSIAKGFGVDKVAELLNGEGFDNYLVDVGGEVQLRGVNVQRQPWRLAIEKPVSDTRAVERIIAPGDMAVATSGDYRNYFEQDGVRYSHTIDPKTFRPINHRLVSVTVIHRSCMTADGLATALDVLGPEKGMQLAEQLQLPVLMIVKTDNGFAEHASTAFKPYLEEDKG